MKTITDVQVNFWKHVDKQTDCWLWTGGCSGGYGNFANTSGYKYAHRASYEFLVGEIPKGMHLHHTCHQKLCVNPAHLVTMAPSDHARLHSIRSDTEARIQLEKNKVMTTLRLTPKAKRLLKEMSDHMGLSQASVVEIAVRDLAEKKGSENT